MSCGIENIITTVTSIRVVNYEVEPLVIQCIYLSHKYAQHERCGMLLFSVVATALPLDGCHSDIPVQMKLYSVQMKL